MRFRVLKRIVYDQDGQYQVYRQEKIVEIRKPEPERNYIDKNKSEKSQGKEGLYRGIPKNPPGKYGQVFIEFQKKDTKAEVNAEI